MKVLYLGPNYGTSAHRADAFRRLGHQVDLFDPHLLIPASLWAGQWIRRTGALFLESYIRERVLRGLPKAASWDVALVDGGTLVGPTLVRALKARCARVINFNHDDPFGPRDLRTWRLYLKALTAYDAVAVVRNENVLEARERGANVRYFPRAADEVAHAKRDLTPQDRAAWASEVLFVGTWMPERGPFMARLLQLGVPLTIYGIRWQKAPEWPVLRHAWRGGELDAAGSYSKAILASKVCLGLVSKGNRDQSTTRSAEIPLLGRAFCAERTPEHTRMYIEGEEAEFWITPEECAEKCRQLLSDDERRESIAERGRRRCLRNGALNEQVLADLLDWAMAPAGNVPDKHGADTLICR